MDQHRDTADWTGIEMCSIDVGGGVKNSRWSWNGVHYVTEGEFDLAKLLTAIGIPFTPNVAIVLRDAAPYGAFVPDFVFNARSYVWRGDRVIHGFEVKGRITPKAVEKARLLFEQRGISILLLTDRQVKRFARAGRLPLLPLQEPDDG
jgi:hypothetical protein